MSVGKTQPDGSMGLDTARGGISARRLAPGILLLEVRGYATIDCFNAVIPLFDKEIELSGSMMFFCDGEHFQNYESAFREAWQNWLKKNRKQVSEVPMLVTSPMVKMGLQVVNLATGGPLKPISNREAFEERIRAKVPGFQARAASKSGT